jgi:hypothetical protein
MYSRKWVKIAETLALATYIIKKTSAPKVLDRKISDGCIENGETEELRFRQKIITDLLLQGEAGKQLF